MLQWGYYDGRVDGVFGADTSAAVRHFQRRNGLTPDGVVGPTTWAALGYYAGPARQAPARRASPAAAGGQKHSRDLTLLAQAVRSEAEAEPYEGQVAVAAVILNRVEHPSYPKTIAGVIFQPGAFEAVSNGTFFKPPLKQSIRAAQDALNGWDPSHGAIFYWNPATAKSKWIWTRKIHARIGKHVFAK